MSKDFASAKKAYLSGDKRKLADFVRANETMTDEQAEFVAQAIVGDVKVRDGRSEKPWNTGLYLDYVEIMIGGDLRRILFGENSVPTLFEKKPSIRKSTIIRKLAEIYGHTDDNAKKAISRAEQRRDGRYDLLEVLEHTQSQGRRPKFLFSLATSTWPRKGTETGSFSDGGRVTYRVTEPCNLSIGKLVRDTIEK